MPRQLDHAFGKARANRTELEKVIAHYSSPEDSLKLRAAYFLIENMEGLYYYEGKQLEQYFEYIKLIKLDSDQKGYVLQSFEDLYAPFSYSNLKRCNILRNAKATELISNIEMAFKVWKEQPWGKDITFEQFCEYILPFRVGDEIPENSREEIYKKFNPLLDSVRRAGGGAVSACTVINDELRKGGWLSTGKAGFLPYFPPTILLEHRTGSCRDMTATALYVMRAVGIPVSIDLVKQWPYRNSAHAWNIVLDKSGKSVKFMGMEQSPGISNKPGTRKGKCTNPLLIGQK